MDNEALVQKWVIHTVSILDIQTGEIVEYSDKFGANNPTDYLWGDGNYSCDCNRSIFFHKAKGIEDYDMGCGDERYAVLSVKDSDGKLLYAENPDRTFKKVER